jgi:hypothetical protein
MKSYQKTINSIHLAKLLSFGEKDIKNGNVINHETAKKIFEKTLGKIYINDIMCHKPKI